MVFQHRTVVTVALLAFFAGCARKDDESAALRSRLNQLESRLVASEQLVSATQRSLNEIRARLAAIEARPPQVAFRPEAAPDVPPPAPGGQAPAPPPPAALLPPASFQGAAKVVDLGRQLAEKEHALDQQYPDDRGSAEVQAARRELMRWYAEQKKAILAEERGEAAPK